MQNIPDYVLTVIKKLDKNGFEAYLVGGCVRDFIMNVTPNDFDITTNALPHQLKTIFSEYKVILTGEKHGTVTVVINEKTVEITTYRIDMNYTDSRHPNSVIFTNYLEDDLKRRDFTMNAMAMSRNGEIIDLFGGKSDIKNGIIRTVGDAKERFSEDGLRIMRALRFASRLGFSLDTATYDAVFECKKLLEKISYERITSEFVQLIFGKCADNILREYRDIIAVFIPEIVPCFNFEQHSPYHKFDVWEHTIHAVKESSQKENVKIAMFFHDISKPECCVIDENGRGHFKGHPLRSSQIAEIIMKRMRFSNNTIDSVKTLIIHHSDELKDKYEIRKLVGQIGFENALSLIDVQRADSLSKHEFCRERLKESDNQERIIKEILENNDCVSIKDLKINGNDLMEIGFEGIKIKEVLNLLLDKVMTDSIENDPIQLVNCAYSLK